jgi:hypothetical protein
VFRRSAPLRPISLPKDRCLPAHCSLSSQRSRSLVTAFPSPATAAPFQKPPFQGQWSRPATSRPPGSIRCPVRLRLPCLHWFAPVEGSFFASGPLPLFAPVRSAASSVSTPLQDFYIPRDRSVQQIPPPCGSPSESARFPLAPRCPSIASVDWGSPFLDRYVFGGLLFLKPLGTFFTMLLSTFFVNAFRVSCGTISSVFIYFISIWLQV